MTDTPFILSKRKTSPYYQVRFKNPDPKSPVKYFPAKSTKETIKSKAIAKAWSMYNETEVKKASTIEQLKSTELNEEEVQSMLRILTQRGVLKSYTISGAENSIPLIQFLTDFWNKDKSAYIKEKIRMKKHIGLTYITESQRMIITYWKPFFEGKNLGDLTKRELKDFISHIDTLPLSNSRKLKIYRSGSIAIKWAYNDELIDRDITSGIVTFSNDTKERKILTLEVAELLFSIRWKDERAQLANLIAMLTGMRAGEILALRKQDLGNGCIYVNHSWNKMEGLKKPKNGDQRIVYFPFPTVTQKMLQYVSYNPLGDNMDSFVFWAEQKPQQPMDIKKLPIALHNQLMKIGFSEKEAKSYCFHSWRHFYAAYMSDNVNQRALQSQTGHKTIEMLEHYENHHIESDMIQITTAQQKLFGNVVNSVKL